MADNAMLISPRDLSAGGSLRGRWQQERRWQPR